MQLSGLRNPRTTFEPPSAEERRAAIAGMKWYFFDLFGYEPHSAQMDFHLSDARFRMSIAGTRGGKSRSAGEEAVIYLFAGATRVWLVGQRYEDTAKEFDYIYTRMVSPELAGLFNNFPPLEQCIYNESQGNMYIRTKWGSWVKCISLERTGGALGEEVDLIIMCEGAQIKDPKGTWERELRGRLASRLGDLIIPTTPAGKASKKDPDGWLFSMYQKGYDPEYEDYFTREWPSWENPDFLEDPYELRRELDPKIFAEQYEGKFIVFAGSVYTNFDSNVHVIEPFSYPRHWRRYEAIDPGFSGQFAWLAAVVSENGNVYVVNEYTDSETGYEDRVEAIKDARCREYGIPDGWIDKGAKRHSWDRFAEVEDIRVNLYIDPEDSQCAYEFARLGLPGAKANNNIMVGIDRLQRRLRWTRLSPPTLYITSNCTQFEDAMRYHAWGEKGTGIRKPANDPYKHLADCGRYICAAEIVSSPPPRVKAQEEGYLWELLMGMHSRDGAVPWDLSPYERRMGGHVI